MRILWLCILTFVIGAIAVVVFDSGEEPGLDLAAAPSESEPPAPAPTPPATAAPTTTPEPPLVMTPPATVQTLPTAPDDAAHKISALALELAESATQRVNTLRAAETPEVVQSEEEVSDKPIVTAGLDVDIAHAEVIEGSIRQLSDRKLWVDGEWTLTGSGTAEDPYEPTWEYLFSAADTYQPRLGENEIPQRIAMLDGKWVRIAGFTAFPLVVGETKEMLVMLNKWDGCCIGVPPTPFDALEVHLQEAVQRGPMHSINYGTITGRMKVDPYLIENWLVGLYILENSSFMKDL